MVMKVSDEEIPDMRERTKREIVGRVNGSYNIEESPKEFIKKVVGVIMGENPKTVELNDHFDAGELNAVNTFLCRCDYARMDSEHRWHIKNSKRKKDKRKVVEDKTGNCGTIRPEGSSNRPSMNKEECKKWVKEFLSDESKYLSDIGDVFEKYCGRNNFEKLGYALDRLKEEGAVLVGSDSKWTLLED